MWSVLQLFYSKLGPNVAKQHVLLCDPMVATGGSACKAVEVIKEAGVPEEKITFLCIVAAPEGIVRLRAAFPKCVVNVQAMLAAIVADSFSHAACGVVQDEHHRCGSGFEVEQGQVHRARPRRCWRPLLRHCGALSSAESAASQRCDWKIVMIG